MRILTVLLLLAACNSDEPEDSGTDSGTEDSGDTNADELAIAGSYTDEWGSSHTIDSTTWTMDASVFHIATFDNGAGVVIAQNDAANTYSPDLWSRFDFVDDAGDIWFCQSAYDAASEDAANQTAAADATDPSTGGCGGFAWTHLTP